MYSAYYKTSGEAVSTCAQPNAIAYYKPTNKPVVVLETKRVEYFNDCMQKHNREHLFSCIAKKNKEETKIVVRATNEAAVAVPGDRSHKLHLLSHCTIAAHTSYEHTG